MRRSGTGGTSWQTTQPRPPSPAWDPDPNTRRGRCAAHNLHVHLLFVTKYRSGVLDPEMLKACEQLMAQVCADFDATLAGFNAEQDHVHLARAVPPESGALPPRQLPGRRLSRRLRQDFVGRINSAATGGKFWSPSYFARSCGGAPLSIVKDHIDNQKRPSWERFLPAGKDRDSAPRNLMTCVLQAASA